MSSSLTNLPNNNKNTPKKHKHTFIHNKQFSHLQYTNRFKHIRTQHNNTHQLLTYQLSKDTHTKRIVIVKACVYEDDQQLQRILQDYQQLCVIYEECDRLCQFVGYYLAVDVIYFVYDYYQDTLAETINTMKRHHSHSNNSLNKKAQNYLSQNQISQFLADMVSILQHLENHGYNYLCWSFQYVLVENLGNIDMKYRLLFTPFLVDAVQQIQNCKPNIQDYFLSEHQLSVFSSGNSAGQQQDIPYSDKMRSDKQSLGLMALRMATLSNEHDKFYSMNTNYQLTWNQQGLKNRLQTLHQNYSKQLVHKIQYLIFDQAFYSFKDATLFNNNKHSPHKNNKQIKDGQSYRYPSQSRSRVSCTSNNSQTSKKYSPNKVNNHRNKHNNKESLGCSKYSTNKKYDSNQFSSIKRSHYQHNQHQVSNLNNFSFESINNEDCKSAKQKYQQADRQRLNEPQKIKKMSYEKHLKYQEAIFYDKIPKDTIHRLSDTKIGEKYIGQIKAGRKNGMGINYNRQGDVYFGEWLNDQMNGNGIYLFRNGDLYSGQVRMGLKNGVGKYEHWNGNYYNGYWQNDVKNGHGVYIYKTKGDSYDGQFKNNLRHGFGTYKWSDGSKYEGEFIKGIKNGLGTAYLVNGTKIQGRWHNDILQDNQTKIKYASGSQYNGQVNMNKLTGKGQQIRMDGFKCTGQYRNNQRYGQCQILYTNGDKYSGDIVNNKPDGHGTYTYACQNMQYIGSWSNGQQDGDGIVRFKNGTEIECRWQRGQYQKMGRISYANGDEYCGQISGLGRNGRGVYVSCQGETVKGVFQNGVLVDIQ